MRKRAFLFILTHSLSCDSVHRDRRIIWENDGGVKAMLPFANNRDVHKIETDHPWPVAAPAQSI
ncbi:MAG: hypothetical protein O2824_02120, partial [Proteobacteria bacterium]|nr:hypothetical protein [Pseudomonadota bacterium]